MKKLYIVGAGGFGREILWLVQRINEHVPTWKFSGFIDDNAELQGLTQNGYPILGDCDYLQKVTNDVWVVIAVGAAQVKKKIVKKLEQCSNIKFATLIDPSVLWSDSVSIGEGSIICAGSVLTVDVKIGNHVAVNLNCTVGHDAVLQDYTTVYPGVHISGNVAVGQCVELGTGSQIIQGKKIENNIVVGAGSVVTKDLLEQGTYVGVPVRKVK